MLANEIRILSDDQLRRVHDAALEVLEKCGFRVEEANLRKELLSRGANEKTAECLTIPRELVTECIEEADTSPFVHCVNGKYSPKVAATVTTDRWLPIRISSITGRGYADLGSMISLVTPGSVMRFDSSIAFTLWTILFPVWIRRPPCSRV